MEAILIGEHSTYDSAFTTSENNMNSDKAYRELKMFKCWLEGQQKFAPWMNKVYLVTDDQKTSWLNINSDQSVLVDYLG